MQDYPTQAAAIKQERINFWGTPSARDCSQLVPAPRVPVTVRGKALFIHFDNFGRVQFVHAQAHR
jgi:hypothetical protein